MSVLAQRGNRLVPSAARRWARAADLRRPVRRPSVRRDFGRTTRCKQWPLDPHDLGPSASSDHGYSAYLHPTGDGTLLGVGQEATDQGRRLGTQVSLFDVGDPARPRRVAQYHLQDGHSEVEFDPHAFLYWPASGLVVLPVTRPYDVSDPDRPASAGSGALVLRLHDGTLDRLGIVRQRGDGVIRRSLVVGDTLWTVSDAGPMRSRVVTSPPGLGAPSGLTSRAPPLPEQPVSSSCTTGPGATRARHAAVVRSRSYVPSAAAASPWSAWACMSSGSRSR